MKKQTFNVYCAFNLIYTFPGKELVQDPGGDEGEFEPRDRAIEKLQKELTEYLRLKYELDPVRCTTSYEGLLD
jgi:hypothetical protein